MKHSLAGRLLRNCLALIAIYLSFSALNAVQAQTVYPFTTIMYFNGVSASDKLVFGTDGKLYGPAQSVGGGAPAGLIYYVRTDGTDANTLYQYGRLGVFTGNSPHGALLSLSDHFLYGTTLYTSAAAISNAATGAGTVFKLSEDGTYTKLYGFTDPTSLNISNTPINIDGVLPQSPLIQGADGYLYGTTVYGGANGTGTIFKIHTDGSGFQSLHSFDAIVTTTSTDATTGVVSTIADVNADGRIKNTEGANPTLRLLQAADGFIYGTAPSGGVNGTGTIFKIKADGTGFTVLKTFDVSPTVITDTTDPNYGLIRTNTSGAYPSSPLLQAPNGLLYGTMNGLGIHGYGSVYSFAPTTSTFTTLYSFNQSDGANPSGELIISSDDGMLVGTTSTGGTLTAATADTAAVLSSGTLYKLSLDGTTLTTLYPFAADGIAPLYGVIQGSDGGYYGATSQGGAYGIGTVFKFGGTTAITIPIPIGTPNYDNGYGSLSLMLMLALMALILYRYANRHRLS